MDNALKIFWQTTFLRNKCKAPTPTRSRQPYANNTGAADRPHCSTARPEIKTPNSRALVDKRAAQNRRNLRLPLELYQGVPEAGTWYVCQLMAGWSP